MDGIVRSRGVGSLIATAAVGMIMEMSTFRHLYARSYLDQVLCTIGLNMFLNELVRVIWGPRPLHMGLPPALAGTIELLPGSELPDPAARDHRRRHPHQRRVSTR